jgi:hypothetical protein
MCYQGNSGGGSGQSKSLPTSVQQRIAAVQKARINWANEAAKIIPLKESWAFDSSKNDGTCTVYLKLPDEIEESSQIKIEGLDETSVFIRARPFEEIKQGDEIATPEGGLKFRENKTAKLEYRMVLAPLMNEIAVEDIVMKFKKKKLSLLLFIKDRSCRRWGSQLLRSGRHG